MARVFAAFALFIVLSLPTAAPAQGIGRLEFDARQLTYAEKRVVQAALAFSGDYVGLLDGAWGRGSQGALERYTRRTAGSDRPEYRHLVPLLADFDREVRIHQWRTFHFEATDTSFAHPVALLEKNADPDVIRYDSADGQLTLIVNFEDADGTLALHGYFLREAHAVPEPYQNFAPGRIITAVTLDDGVNAYVRSDAIHSGFVTLAILAGKEHRGRLALIAGSMQRGPAPELTLPANGMLEMVLSDTGARGIARPQTPPPPAVMSEPDPNPFDGSSGTGGGNEPDSSGTAFYINNTDLVTAAHVVEGCGRLALADGAPLDVIATDEGLDLAVLSSPRRSPVWLEVGNTASARLGAPVTAIGFPYIGLGQGLTATGGNISALQGIGGTGDRIMFSAPVQPGNSGGPLLGASGAVIGVVVSRLDDLEMLEDTGTLPQNMNFATPNARLGDFLREAGVLFPEATGRRFDLSEGIPDEVSAAVLPVFCYR